MSEARKLSQEEMDAIFKRMDFGYYGIPAEGYLSLDAAQDVYALRAHIAAMEAEQKRVASRTAKDAFEVGVANMNFNERQTEKTQELQKALLPFMPIIREMERQDEKWGDQSSKHPATWVAILVEEVGEVAKAVLEGNPKECRQELIQVAAVAVQFIRALTKQAGETS